MGNRVHRWLAASVVAIALGAFAGWRALGSAPTGLSHAATPVPSPQLNQLIPYAKPLPDTVVAAPRSEDSIVLDRDPFALGGAPSTIRVAQRPAAHVAAANRAAAPWDVTATLIAGGRRAAVINDVLIYVGGEVPPGGRTGGATLTAVERDHVVITDSKGTAHRLAVKERDG